jgi:type IV pilus assembly protein PilW
MSALGRNMMPRHIHSSRLPLAGRQSGMTLIELMVALAIGAFLMIGAVTVFMQSRTTFRITESVSRLQENGRFVLDVLEPDIRMAHYWGLTSRTFRIINRAGAVPPGPAVAAPATCGATWTIDLDNEVGTNNGYGFACAGFAPVEVNADTYVVRRVSEDALAAAALTPNTLYVQSTRGGTPGAQIFAGTAIPADFDPATSETHQLVVNGYYVSRGSSTLGANVPSLRVKTLLAGGVIQDQEVLPGVEDMQIQYGVDTDVEGAPNRRSIDRYVNANDPILNPANAAFLPDAEILSVRIWLRLRAERPENGFTDTANYVYADQNVGPFNDAFRRIVVSKTIFIRNALPPS